MGVMSAFGFASVMLCLGMFFRAKISVFRNMLMPASVIAGVIGFIFMNVLAETGAEIGFQSETYTEIVNQLFIISFISISLTTNTAQKEGGDVKNFAKGTFAMGIIWCLLYAVTPLVGTGIVALLGGKVGMDAVYGMLVQFAFCQGPGQAAAYGMIFEQYGWEQAAMTAVTFSAIGFIVAFGMGVPAAKLGIKRGLARYCGKIDEKTLKGYLNRNEQSEYMMKDTTCGSNIETLSFHFALIGVSYLLAVLIGRIFSYLPGFLGTSMSSMMFMNGMYAAYIVRYIIKKLHIDFLQETILQNKITSWTADYLVVCSFMAIAVKMLKDWLPLILIVSIFITLITFAVCFYFGQRIGGQNDFERTLGLYGMCTGTVPTGVAIVRIVDPDFKTTTSLELGACNLIMLASTPVYLIILALAAGSIKMTVAVYGLLICVIIYLVILKLTKCWGKATFRWER